MKKLILIFTILFVWCGVVFSQPKVIKLTQGTINYEVVNVRGVSDIFTLIVTDSGATLTDSIQVTGIFAKQEIPLYAMDYEGNLSLYAIPGAGSIKPFNFYKWGATKIRIAIYNRDTVAGRYVYMTLVENAVPIPLSSDLSVTMDAIEGGYLDSISNITVEIPATEGGYLDSVSYLADIANIVNIEEVANVTSVDLVDAVTSVATVDEVANVTSVDLVDAVTEVANVTSVDLVDEVTEVGNLDGGYLDSMRANMYNKKDSCYFGDSLATYYPPGNYELNYVDFISGDTSVFFLDSMRIGIITALDDTLWNIDMKVCVGGSTPYVAVNTILVAENEKYSVLLLSPLLKAILVRYENAFLYDSRKVFIGFRGVTY